MTDILVKGLKVAATIVAAGVALIVGEEVYNGFDTAVDGITTEVNNLIYEDKDIITRGRFGKEKVETVKVNRFTKNPKI